MQYGIDEYHYKSSLERIQDFQEPLLPTESVESLDILLSQFHSKNQQQMETEHKIIAYLRSLGLQFKTDPRQKELDYSQYLIIVSDKSKFNKIIFQQAIGESPQVGPLKNKFGEENNNENWLNIRVLKRQNNSFEL